MHFISKYADICIVCLNVQKGKYAVWPIQASNKYMITLISFNAPRVQDTEKAYWANLTALTRHSPNNLPACAASRMSRKPAGKRA